MRNAAIRAIMKGRMTRAPDIELGKPPDNTDDTDPRRTVPGRSPLSRHLDVTVTNAGPMQLP